jgi:SET domain-containing protein
MLKFIKNKIGQISLVSTKEFKKDDILFDLNMGEFHKNPSLRSIELSPEIHVVNPWGAFTNHHCEPTAYVFKQDRTMRAKRDIQPEEEITFDYMENETNISTSFHCQCGSVRCRRTIGSSDSTPSHLDNPS